MNDNASDRTSAETAGALADGSDDPPEGSVPPAEQAASTNVEAATSPATRAAALTRIRESAFCLTAGSPRAVLTSFFSPLTNTGGSLAYVFCRLPATRRLHQGQLELPRTNRAKKHGLDLPATLGPVLKAAQEHARDVDATGAFPEHAIESLRRSGLFGLTLPTDVGGLGGGPEDLVEALSRIAAVCGSTAMVYLMHLASAMAVASDPPPGRPELVRQLASGERLGTLAFSEAGSCSHFWAPVSQSQTDNGGIHLKTRKSGVTSAGHADTYVVFTLTSPALAPTDVAIPIDMFVVDAGTPGVEVAGEFRGLGLRVTPRHR